MCLSGERSTDRNDHDANELQPLQPLPEQDEGCNGGKGRAERTVEEEARLRRGG